MTQLQDLTKKLRDTIEQDEALVVNARHDKLSSLYFRANVLLTQIEFVLRDYENEVEDMLDNVTVLVDSVADKS